MARTPDLELTLAGIIIQQLRLPPDTTISDSNNLEDLGLDSLGMLAFIACIEREFGVGVSDEAYEGLVTFGDALTLVGGRAP